MNIPDSQENSRDEKLRRREKSGRALRVKGGGNKRSREFHSEREIIKRGMRIHPGGIWGNGKTLIDNSLRSAKVDEGEEAEKANLKGAWGQVRGSAKKKRKRTLTE